MLRSLLIFRFWRMDGKHNIHHRHNRWYIGRMRTLELFGFLYLFSPFSAFWLIYLYSKKKPPPSGSPPLFCSPFHLDPVRSYSTDRALEFLPPHVQGKLRPKAKKSRKKRSVCSEGEKTVTTGHRDAFVAEPFHR